jgi:hypothetical protein
MLGLMGWMLSLYEARKGTLDTPYARELTQAALGYGSLVYHVYLSGRKQLFLPRGIILTKEASLVAIKMGLEVVPTQEV